MEASDYLMLSTVGLYPVLLGLEHLNPARWQPRLPAWRLTGAAAFALFLAIGFFLPLALPVWFSDPALPGAKLGIAGGAVAGYLAVSLVAYVWHRAAHESPLLWRLFHQLHHAPNRLDVSSAAIFHPTEMVFYTLMPLTVTTLLLGLEPLAAALVGLLTTFNAVLQHANLRTPRWLGWFIQRPEAHSIHHAEHDGNFSDFPLWDRLFGTYREPQGFRERAGFAAGVSRRWGQMLLFRDAHAPLQGGDASKAMATSSSDQSSPSR